MGTTKETTPDEQPTQAASDPVVEEATEQQVPEVNPYEGDPLEYARSIGIDTSVRESIAVELASETEGSPVGHSTSLDAYTG